MDLLPLSVCIIARNEEALLPGCLESVQSIATQIVVVDTGSTDSTKTLAQRYGAEVHDFIWQDDFSAARNEALCHAREPWILVLDADERLRDVEHLAPTLLNAGADVGGFLISIYSRSSVGSSIPTPYVTQTLRLFRNHPSIRYSGLIHEQILPSVINAGYRCVLSNVTIEHLGYDLDPIRMQEKHHRNLLLLDRAIAAEPTDAFYRYHRAKTLIALGKLDAAEKDLVVALQTAQRDGLLRPQVLNTASLLAAIMERYHMAIRYAEESLTLVPNQSMCWYLIGEAYRLQGNPSAALDAYLRCNDALQNNDYRPRLIGSLLVPRTELNQRIEQMRQLTTNSLQIRSNNDNYHTMYSNQNPVSTTHFLKENPTMSRPFLSLAMIVRNEEETLPQCLESVQNAVDQIVIVDTGSRDRTIDVARRFNAETYSFEWCDDFAAARNEALRYCRGEWILYLDADERLTPDTARQLRTVLQQQPQTVGALLCTIISPHRAENSTVEIHRGAYPRLFRNYGYPRLAFRGRVHEQITPAIIECGGSIVHSPITIEHNGYNAPPEKLEQKVRRNYHLLIQHVQEEPLNGYAWFQLAQTLARMHLHQPAEQAFLFAIQMGLSAPIAASAENALANLCGIQGRFQEALQWAESSLSRVPNQLLALNYKAHAHAALGQIDQARVCFEKLLQLLDDSPRELAVGFEIDLDRSYIEQKIGVLRQSPISVNAGQRKNTFPIDI